MTLRMIAELRVPDEVKKDIEYILDALLGKFASNIGRVILFGSYASGKYQPDSDIDLAVVLKEMPDPKERRLYKQAVDIDREVDLLFCTEEQLAGGGYVYKYVKEQGIALYEQL